MKTILKAYILIFAFVIGGGFVLHKAESMEMEPLFKAGDIIFISNESGQGKAIQLATKSKYTHVGVILNDGGKLVVFHAVEPVKKNTIQEFIKYSADGTYDLMRLKDPALLDAAALEKMTSEASKLLGTHYDLAFSWDDKELYCSEYVWKLYKHATGLEVGKLKPLGSFDLSSPVVKRKLEERYGKNIPLTENMISPGDMHDSELLMKVH
ncbi:MAG: peptidoglycan peptidase [Bacteroidetes bacterium]|nr:peptidoglycan peptidase [Bacteroidota bacterium]